MADRPRRAHYRVQVTFRDAQGRSLLEQDIQPPCRGLPGAVDENRLDRSWNLAIDGSLVRPGNTVLAELRRAGRAQVLARFPADGLPLPLNVVPVPPIHLVLIPVRVGDRVGRLERDGRTLEDPWNTAYYYAVLPEDAFAPDPWTAERTIGQAGDPRFLGFRAGGNLARTAAGEDGEGYALTLAHELGHVFGCLHAPAGGAGLPDPDLGVHRLPEHALVMEPVARRAHGVVSLEWDPGVYPRLLVRDPATGRHLATLGGGLAEFPDPGLEALDLLLSDGIRSRAVRVRVLGR